MFTGFAREATRESQRRALESDAPAPADDFEETLCHGSDPGSPGSDPCPEHRGGDCCVRAPPRTRCRPPYRAWRACPVRNDASVGAEPVRRAAVWRDHGPRRSVAGVRGVPPGPWRERRRSGPRQERRPAMGRRDQAVHDRASPRRLPADPRGPRGPEGWPQPPDIHVRVRARQRRVHAKHGFPTWPDPISTTDAGRMPEGFDKADPAVLAALNACESILVETTASPSPGL